MITNQFLKIWLLSVNIINFEEILLIFLILRPSRINEVRLQNLYLALCKHSLYTFFYAPCMEPYNEYQWGKSRQVWLIQWHITSLYLQPRINVLSACHFTNSPKTQEEQNFIKFLIISYRVNAPQRNFLKILCYHILTSHKSLSWNE